MIYGIGKPYIELWRNGTDYEYIYLPQPTERSEKPFEIEIDTRKNILDEIIVIDKKFRYKDTFTFVNLSEADADKIIRIANWDGDILLKPFSDGFIKEWVLVNDIIIRPHEKIIIYTDISIEFIGKFTRNDIPRDPEYYLTINQGSNIKSAII